MDLMNGAQFAKAYVNDYLKSDLPIRLVSYRNGWGVDDAVLPTPAKFVVYEPLVLDHWPTIITIVISTNKLERIGYDKSNPLYRVEYSMRTYIWAKADGAEETTIMRDRLTTVVRSALLDYPCLKAYDENHRESFRLVIDEGSMREEFSDLTLVKGDRYLSGAYVSYTLSMDEVVMREVIGILAETILTIQTSGANEALPELTAP